MARWTECRIKLKEIRACKKAQSVASGKLCHASVFLSVTWNCLRTSTESSQHLMVLLNFHHCHCYKERENRKIFDAREKQIFAEDTTTKRKYICLDKKLQLLLTRKKNRRHELSECSHGISWTCEAGEWATWLPLPWWWRALVNPSSPYSKQPGFWATNEFSPSLPQKKTGIAILQ